MNAVRKPKPVVRRRYFIYLFVGIVGASCAWVLVEHALAKNRLIEIGRRQREVEHETSELEREIRGFDLKIGESLSRQNLMDKLAVNRTRLRPIVPGAPIIVKAAPTEDHP